MTAEGFAARLPPWISFSPATAGEHEGAAFAIPCHLDAHHAAMGFLGAAASLSAPETARGVGCGGSGRDARTRASLWSPLPSSTPLREGGGRGGGETTTQVSFSFIALARGRRRRQPCWDSYPPSPSTATDASLLLPCVARNSTMTQIASAVFVLFVLCAVPHRWVQKRYRPRRTFRLRTCYWATRRGLRAGAGNGRMPSSKTPLRLSVAEPPLPRLDIRGARRSTTTHTAAQQETDAHFTSD
ncbi:uncharacterized protein Tco025E_04514 [Trypanosoma conorhini]|uniref:Uncharacterized protein n=1 Tax=Trypanosoma conorhini TaxID=83891 RepID=A0A3R7P6T4_9TRYP|nr:uncharacterized protein Tco025E_04514 [Trypanosoma conorhini]RNF18397.1 hypothetical protein Tco025E_04514 [Trypanosoma conorhini]